MSYEIRCPKCLAEYNSRMVHEYGSTIGKLDASCLVCGFGKQFQEQKTQEGTVQKETKVLLKDSGFNMKNRKVLAD